MPNRFHDIKKSHLAAVVSAGLGCGILITMSLVWERREEGPQPEETSPSSGEPFIPWRAPHTPPSSSPPAPPDDTPAVPSPSSPPLSRSPSSPPEQPPSPSEEQTPRELARLIVIDEAPALPSSEASDHDPSPRDGESDDAPPLGPMQWMPRLPDEQRDALDDDITTGSARVQEEVATQRSERAAFSGAFSLVDHHARACYDAYLRIDPMAQGSLLISTRITSLRGRATLSDVAITSEVYLHSPILRDCILSRLEGASFPAFGDSTLVVSYPIGLPTLQVGQKIAPEP